MSKEYAYFPGCSLKSSGAAYEKSVLSLFKILDLPLREIDDWNCCGATSYMAIEEASAFTLSARNLSIAAKQGGGDVVAPCSACYLVLRKTQDYVQHYPEVRKEVSASLERAGLGPVDGVRVRHPLEVIYTDIGLDAIKKRVVRKWTGGPVACYYGCQIVRPYDEVDRAHNPMRMDELLRAAGIPTVEYPLKTKCCGGSLTGTIHDVGVRMNYILLKEARRRGAQSIATVCPLCQFNLDVYQSEIEGDDGERYDVPVLYFTQLLAWALGADPAALGLKKAVSGRDLISRWFTAQKEEVEAYV